MSCIFISGSISIKTLPAEVKNSILKIIQNKFEILVGDANGVDSLIQNFCLKKNYENLTIYTIKAYPRYIANKNFNIKQINISNEIKKERQRQQEKDKAMTKDSNYSFVIWDGKSKGSYLNIIRSLEVEKKVKVYLDNKNQFLNQSKININEIEFIYRENNGYTASEIVEYLKNKDINFFQKTQDLNKYLIEKTIIEKNDKTYKPIKKYENLFIIEKYKGKVKGIKFKNKFIIWIEKKLYDEKRLKQASLF